MDEKLFNRVADFFGVRSPEMRIALRLVFVEGFSQSDVLSSGISVSQQSLSRAVNSWRNSLSEMLEINEGINMIDRKKAKQICEIIRIRSERTLVSMAFDNLDYSLREGAIYRDFSILVPYAIFESTPDKSYSHWVIYGLDESYSENEFLLKFGSISVEHWKQSGVVLLLYPRKELSVNAGNAYSFESQFMPRVRTFDEQKVYDLYWEAISVFSDINRNSERITAIRNLLQSMSHLSYILSK